MPFLRAVRSYVGDMDIDKDLESDKSMDSDQAVDSDNAIAERDFPPGCRPGVAVEAPVQVQVQVPTIGRRTRSPNPNAEPLPRRASRSGSIPASPSTPRPSIDMVWNFVVEPNDTPEELYAKRRKRYAALMGYFQQLQDRGELPGKGRPDLEATKRMTQDKQTFDWKGVGSVPGTAVGDFFYYRTELYVLGLHRAMQAGIAYTKVKGVKMGCSIVASGGYEDDVDQGMKMTYTGHGGNNKADKRQVRDQVPEGGNLALKNSCYQSQPVRVIRGHSNIPINQSPSRKLYSYDGLYNIVSENLEPGNSGFRVFKFKLERQPGQPELGSKLVSFMGKVSSATPRAQLVMEDISENEEPIPVAVVNPFDDGVTGPPAFEYIRTLRYPPGFIFPSIPSSECACQDCNTNRNCSCGAKNNGRMIPYNQYGQLVRALPAVYECGNQCRCSENCHNRVCQKGIRYRLEIFKTANKGWGVRSWDFIPPGGFVCEYTGEVMDTHTANEMEDDEYLFNLDFKQGNKARWGDEITNIVGDDELMREQPKYVIDASKCGGVARFINHSCKPNLFVQCVMYGHCDLDLPHVMLFAAQGIRPLQELTYDYGYALDSVFDENGVPKQKPCHCDARNCRGRMY